MITLIYACDKNGCIGKNNELPWHDKLELKHFRNATKGKVVVMGYNTWSSLGCKPLPHRTNVVITNRKQDNIVILNNVHFMHALYAKERLQVRRDEIMIIGGVQTYKLFEDIADRIMVSRGDFEVENGDAFYIPNIDEKKWVTTKEEKISDQFTLYVKDRIR